MLGPNHKTDLEPSLKTKTPIAIADTAAAGLSFAQSGVGRMGLEPNL